MIIYVPVLVLNLLHESEEGMKYQDHPAFLLKGFPCFLGHGYST